MAALFDPRHLEQLKALKGYAAIAFPGSDLGVARVERYLSQPLKAPFAEFLSADPNMRSVVGTVLLEQRQISSDDNYRYIYQRWETLPGVPLSNTTVGGEWRAQFAKDGETIQTQQPVGSDLSQLEDGENVVSGSINQTSKVEGNITITLAPGGFVDLIGSQYQAPGWAKFAKGGIVTSTRSLVAHGDAPDDELETISSEVTPQDDVDAIKTTLSVNEMIDNESLNLINPAALGARTKEVVSGIGADEELPELDWKTISAEWKWVNEDKREQVIVTLDEEDYPTLIGTQIDEVSGIAVEVKKTFVPNGTTGGITGDLNDGPQTYTEIQGYNKYRSISIASKILLPLPEPEVIPVFDTVRLPSELEEVKVVWDQQVSGGAQASEKGAGASSKALVGAVIIVKTRDGYSGPAQGTITRSYHIGIPDPGSIPSETPIIPVSGMAYIMNKFRGESNSISTSGASMNQSAGIKNSVTRIGNVLTNGVTLTGDASKTLTPTPSTAGTGSPNNLTAIASSTAEGIAVLDMPISQPVSLSGTSIIKSVRISRWRLGVYVMEVLELNIPEYAPEEEED